MPKRSSKHPATTPDANEIAAAIVAQIVARTEATDSGGKNPAAVALGRLGGQKGGPARAGKLPAKRRKEIAQQAAKARWAKRTTQ